MHKERYEHLRRPTPREAALLHALLRGPFQGRDELLAQIETARVARWSARDLSLHIEVDRSTPRAITTYAQEALGAYLPMSTGQYEFRVVLKDGYLDYVEIIDNTDGIATELPEDLTDLKLWIYEQSPWSEDQ